MILVLTHSEDFYNIDIFFKYLNSKKIPFFRLNTDRINHLQHITCTAENFIITDEEGSKVSSDQISAVWHRKTWSVQIPEELDDHFSEIFSAEYGHLRHNMYTVLAKLPWINDLEAEYFIQRNKMYQLKIARKAGLDVPDTIFTNDASAVHQFLGKHNTGDAVAKLHGPTVQSMSGANLVETVKFSKSNDQDFESFAFCPMIIQPYIEKQYELRVAFIDGSCFTGKIRNSDKADWRTMKGNLWEPYELPVEIEKKLSVMMQQFNLIFGAIDLIKGVDGNYWFLEVNPQGEWGMLQKELGYPIAQAIADCLIKRMN